MARASYVLESGSAWPLGANWDGLGVNFALFSAHATRVELCLFDSRGRREIARVDLPAYTDEVWHGYLPNARPRPVYGYRVHGPYEPEAGHRFNPHKLLLDPYAKKLVGAVRWGRATRSVSRRPSGSKKQSSTVVACAENSAKLTPFPSQLAPSGNGDSSVILYMLGVILGGGCGLTGAAWENPAA